MISYAAKIAKALGRLGLNGTENPDAKHNQGSILGEYFLWRQVQRYAENKLETVKRDLEKMEVYDKSLDPGKHVLGESPSFVLTAKVTEKVRQFNAEELAILLSTSKYKVPVPIVMDYIDQARVPTKSRTTLEIIER